MSDLDLRHGPQWSSSGGVELRVWAPSQKQLAVRWRGRDLPMRQLPTGFFVLELPDAKAGDDYAFVFPDGRTRPDPASRCQPKGVHQASRLFNPQRYTWKNPRFAGRALAEQVFYELHIGAFTDAGTFDSAIDRLADLVDLGITCVELMPVQPFPGARNWGYDGVLPYGVVEAYGGPEGLQRFVDHAHGLGLGVCLDVVFNHFGPEGNYLREFGPYFTPRHKSPWGDGVNYDGEEAAAVRTFALGAAEQWVRDFHIDALRLDAIHAIVDDSPRHLLSEMTDLVHREGARSGQAVVMVGESDLNERKVVLPPPTGWGCDSVWADDFHHSLHVYLTGESHLFFCDFNVATLVRSLEEGFAYQGEHSVYRGRPHGAPTLGLHPERFVFYSQNHDQVGNRPKAERLTTLLPEASLPAIAALVTLAGPPPLFFMGEEYGEKRPFCFFTSHTDPGLARAVLEGRQKEYTAKGGLGEVADPQAESTFMASKLTHGRSPGEVALRETYRQLLSIRAKHLPLLTQTWPKVTEKNGVIELRRPGLNLRVNLSGVASGDMKPWEWRVDVSPAT